MEYFSEYSQVYSKIFRGSKICCEKRYICEKGVAERLGKEVEIAIFEKDRNQIESLLDVCYDLEMWAGVDVEGIRKKLERIIDSRGDIEE